MTEQDDTLQARLDFLVPLNKLPPDRQQRLLEQSGVLDLKKKQTLFKQGDRDDYTYYVLDGDLEMYADDSLIKSVSGGDAASFQPLAQLQPRQMTAIAKSKVRVLQIDRGLLDQLLSVDEGEAADAPETGVEVEEMEADASGDWLMTMLQSELFSRIPASNIQSLLDTLETVSAAAGENVVTQGEPGDYYYAVQSGKCEVVRTGSKNKEVRLAELVAGDTFGEEALISGAKRNATVRMTADGDLARLTKDDFTNLIKAPLLSTVNRDEADQRAANDALWLDVRFEDEHKHNGLPKSLNTPLSSLRTRMEELDAETSYIVYCDSGGRSSAAAFLLAEKGYDVVYVEGGAVEEPIPEKPEPAPAKKAPAKKAPAKKAAEKPAPAKKAAEKPAPAKKESGKTAPATEETSDSTLEADARASSLAAEVEKATFTIEQAQKMMAEAEAMKAEAENIVADKLASEKQKIDEETEALRDTLAQEKRKVEEEAEALDRTMEIEKEKLEQEAQALGQTLAGEKEKLAQEATELKEKLAEAEKLKSALSKQQKSAEAEAEKRHKQIDKQLAEAEKKAEAKLAKEKKQLESVYEKQAHQLESAQADREAELRAELKEEMAAERKKFEAEFARTTEELEQAREERAAAVTAKEAAAEEAQQMIAEFKAEQKKILDEQHQAIEAEREKLHAEAERIETLQIETAKAREAAEAAQQAAERELEKARTEQAAAADGKVDTTIVEIEERAAAADLDLEQAIEAETVVATAAKNNEDELERTYDTGDEINNLLKRELTDWVDEQEKMQESTLQREVLSKQKEMVERIKARAAAAAADSVSHDKSLLDEIEEQLQSG